jgi:hypothetical protein
MVLGREDEEEKNIPVPIRSFLPYTMSIKYLLSSPLKFKKSQYLSHDVE